MRFLMRAALTLAIIVVLLALGGWLLLRNGLSARAEPGRFERSIARRALRAAIPREDKARRNPYADRADTWRQAADHFGDHCAICHGRDGRGRTPIGTHLYPRAPDMTLAETQQLTDGELFSIIQNGIRFTGMPAWADEHSADDTWQLVSYVRHLPDLTAEELKALEGPPPEAAGRTDEKKPHKHDHPH
jgi:mono/diheme cytochrome c family protein